MAIPFVDLEFSDAQNDKALKIQSLVRNIYDIDEDIEEIAVNAINNIFKQHLDNYLDEKIAELSRMEVGE